SNTPVYDFFYLTGYHREGDFLALQPDGSAVLFADGKAEKVKGVSGVPTVRPRGEFATFVGKSVSKKAPPKVVTRLRKDAKQAVEAIGKGAGATVEAAGQKIQKEIGKLRMIKSGPEIEMIRKASDATNKAHLQAMKTCRAGLNEKVLQTVIEDKFKKEGCDGLGFPSIVGSGKNGVVLHYDQNTDPMPAASMVVCDIGASYLGYVTDITRTLPTSGKFPEEMKKAYQCVLDAQKAAEALLKPGATFGALNDAAAKVFQDRGLEDWCYCHSQSGGPRHSLSHFVGLAVHDSGVDASFEPGVVITIEPGYYNRKGGWGIRIEDIYVVTKDGFERLSAGAPREVDEIEAIMQGKKR
ncbi:MAG TPA: Xaa-Pro peptidase family protein, partial [Planctomycetota bacterium]|nr:Xaa-Pro peptidase family protein [Planctomycetota bacterium]